MKSFNYIKEELIDTGSLVIHVLEEENRRPIEGAKIKIIRKCDLIVIEELVSNTSGKSSTVELKTPPIEYSFNEKKGKPYGEYNLTISAEGFESVEIQGLQIFSSRKSIQAVTLKNIKDAKEINYGVRTIHIFEHRLLHPYPSKVFEEEVKKLDKEENNIWKEDMKIPKEIIVHLGLPEDKFVRNVVVPFKEYIKNVASSEVYPTWPRQTIKARILAIISFTLNRVFTKWYTRKGYEFTITNLTLYDQLFIYGRNIFEEISNIVDETFSTYITKPDIQQPLLSQHCDSLNYRCEKGIKRGQWDLMKLGQNGYDFMSILKKVYGADIYISKSKNIQGIPLHFSEKLIEGVSKGEDVRVIKEKINSIANHYTEITKVEIDSSYGKQIAESVKTFQKIFNMPITGTVDFATWYKIANIYVTLNGIDEPVYKNFHNIYEPYRY